jgi:hypothetical protein
MAMLHCPRQMSSLAATFHHGVFSCHSVFALHSAATVSILAGPSCAGDCPIASMDPIQARCNFAALAAVNPPRIAIAIQISRYQHYEISVNLVCISPRKEPLQRAPAAKDIALSCVIAACGVQILIPKVVPYEFFVFRRTDRVRRCPARQMSTAP